MYIRRYSNDIVFLLLLSFLSWKTDRQAYTWARHLSIRIIQCAITTLSFVIMCAGFTFRSNEHLIRGRIRAHTFVHVYALIQHARRRLTKIKAIAGHRLCVSAINALSASPFCLFPRNARFRIIDADVSPSPVVVVVVVVTRPPFSSLRELEWMLLLSDATAKTVFFYFTSILKKIFLRVTVPDNSTDLLFSELFRGLSLSTSIDTRLYTIADKKRVNNL